MKPLTIRSLLSVALVALGLPAAAVPGKIISPATISATQILDPNGDGFVTANGAAFPIGADDAAAAELPYRALPLAGVEAASDLPAGAAVEAPDLVSTSFGARAVFALVDKAPDAADDRLLVRVRLDRAPPAGGGVSILLDTDLKYGAGLDPNAVDGNPGFELEITMIPGDTGRVDVRSVDGSNGRSATIRTSNAFAARAHLVWAGSAENGTDDLFIDAFVRLAELGTTSRGRVRFAAAAFSSGFTGLAEALVDVAGTDDRTGSKSDRFAEAMEASPVVMLGQLRDGGSFLPVCGDSFISGSETCDDGNTGFGDGCSSACQRESPDSCEGGACDVVDTDGDGVTDAADLCRFEPDPEQKDVDGDGKGDACDIDGNADGLKDGLTVSGGGCATLPALPLGLLALTMLRRRKRR